MAGRPPLPETARKQLSRREAELLLLQQKALEAVSRMSSRFILFEAAMVVIARNNLVNEFADEHARLSSLSVAEDNQTPVQAQTDDDAGGGES